MRRLVLGPISIRGWRAGVGVEVGRPWSDVLRRLLQPNDLPLMERPRQTCTRSGLRRLGRWIDFGRGGVWLMVLKAHRLFMLRLYTGMDPSHLTLASKERCTGSVPDTVQPTPLSSFRRLSNPQLLLPHRMARCPTGLPSSTLRTLVHILMDPMDMGIIRIPTLPPSRPSQTL